MPDKMNTKAMPRPTPVPNQSPINCAPAPVVIKGMKISCVVGPMKNAVKEAIDCSRLREKPKTRP